MKDKKGTATSSEEARKARSAEALRANLLKRKAQTRARRAGEADLRPQGIEASRPASES
jgi:hypothetical protein